MPFCRLFNLFFVEIECLLCDLKCTTVKIMKKHYMDYHTVDENNPHFIELFKPDTVERKSKNLQCEI